MANIGKVENIGPEAQEKAIQLSVSGMSNESIANELNSDFNSDLKSEDVRSFLRRKDNKTAALIKGDKNYQDKLVKQYFDTVKQLQQLNTEMWKFFYEIKKNPEYKDKIISCSHCGKKMTLNIQSYALLLKTADHLLNQIRHVDTVLGKMQKNSFNITYNFVDLSRKIGIVAPKLLDNLEKKGIVKVNKKRLTKYYAEKDEIYN